MMGFQQGYHNAYARNAQAAAQQQRQAYAAEEVARERERQIRASALAQQKANMDAQLHRLQEEQAHLQAVEQSIIRNMSTLADSTPGVAQDPRFRGMDRTVVGGGPRPTSTDRLMDSTRFPADPRSFRASTPTTPRASFMDQASNVGSGSCTPRCQYSCTNPVCDEECVPECASPVCQTRCNGADLSGCKMQCGQPNCAVTCPERPCNGPDCPMCTTHCSKAVCMLQCPQAQPCHSVCESPRCKWRCRAPPSCPKPVCKMQCETPSHCQTSVHEELPPMRAGESLVQSFAGSVRPRIVDGASLQPGVGWSQLAPSLRATNSPYQSVLLQPHGRAMATSAGNYYYGSPDLGVGQPLPQQQQTFADVQPHMPYPSSWTGGWRGITT